MSGRVYIETFEEGTGGWVGWNAEGAFPVEAQNGVAISRSPWWVDYNHAPPGGGYLHLLFVMYTTREPELGEEYKGLAAPNSFLTGGFPTDFTNAKLTARLRGEVELWGAELMLLVQAKVGDFALNHVLVGQPFRVTPEWSEQTITLAPDLGQWKCLGSRHDRMDFYSWGDVADVLRDLDGDIIFVFHPLDVVPAQPLDGDPHRLRADRDYLVDRTRLPEGCVMLDEVRIEFPGR